MVKTDKKIILIMASALLVVLMMLCVGCEETENNTDSTLSTAVTSYMIDDVSVIKQEELAAGCETYACTMLLQSLGYDMDEFMFASDYLIIRYVYEGYGGVLYGPDLDSAYAGDIYTGFGINAPAMAKFMNNYLSDVGADKQAYVLKGESIDDLCNDYVANNIPVMVWATTNMQEPYVAKTWTIDYVDENSTAQIGDTQEWMQNEHCMVLIGFDEQNYYFADSVAGEVSVFDKELSQQMYEKLGSQAIVVK